MQQKSGRAFVIRPFGKKNNRDGNTIDFDLVHNELIQPALEKIGLSGGTTGEFIYQGMIHEDMFREIISADIVIADISIHNANAFYELGIRHALRDRYTVIIRASSHNDPHVFDLKSERYLEYSPDNPADSRKSLQDTILATLDNDSSDSPVFNLLPGLPKLDPGNIVVVPVKFQELVKRVSGQADSATGLVELKKQVYANSWEREGLRVIARSQFEIGDHTNSAITWEELRKFNENDIEANQKLATNYQKLGKYIESDQAAIRSLSTVGATDWDKAETHALIGSNYKTQWRQSFEKIEDSVLLQQQALISDYLERAYEAYRLGFECHRSHYYSGLNAVTMLAIQLALIKKNPEHWCLLHASDSKAESIREDKSVHFEKLKAATELSIESSIKNYNDNWARISQADLMLISSSEPARVKIAYSKYISSIDGFSAESLGHQLSLYSRLGLFDENVGAALEVLKNDK